jgi:hypothetical protein
MAAKEVGVKNPAEETTKSPESRLKKNQCSWKPPKHEIIAGAMGCSPHIRPDESGLLFDYQSEKSTMNSALSPENLPRFLQ